MRRLIDADKLMQDIRNTITEQSSTIDWLNLINRQPTAYDVDEVVKQLEEVKKKNTEIALDDLQKERCFWYKQAVDKAIEIVKGGGVDAKTDS
nr:MAG TPA: hypothetical protein [Caudoviricetes sp.]